VERYLEESGFDQVRHFRLNGDGRLLFGFIHHSEDWRLRRLIRSSFTAWFTGRMWSGSTDRDLWKIEPDWDGPLQRRTYFGWFNVSVRGNHLFDRWIW